MAPAARGGGPVSGFLSFATVADAHGLDAVLANRLDADRETVGADGVAALGQPPELREHETPDRVVGVGVDRQLETVVLEVADGDVPPDEPVAVGQTADGAAGGVVL